MRVDEIRAREALDQILAETLTAAWSEQYDELQVTTTARRGAQRWLLQPLLSALYTRHIGPSARRFIADSFRFTTVRHRVLPQLILGTALASRPGLWATGTPTLWADPAIPARPAHSHLRPSGHAVR